MVTGSQEQRRWAAGVCKQKQNHHLRWEINVKGMLLQYMDVEIAMWLFHAFHIYLYTHSILYYIYFTIIIVKLLKLNAFLFLDTIYFKVQFLLLTMTFASIIS